MIAGALMAWGADPKGVSSWTTQTTHVAWNVVAGALLAAALNAYSNGINQIFDLEVDRINKPWRMLPSNKLSFGEAWTISLLFLAVALQLAYRISVQTLMIVVAASILTFIYSAPPLRTKSRGFLANITVAIPRGTLLIVAGWSTVKDILQPEPWLVGSIFGLFMLGAVSTKDFSDIEGDRKGGCNTLPVKYGIRAASWLISPFFVLPFFALIPAAIYRVLSGNPVLLIALGVALPLWGAYVAFLLLSTSPQEFSALNQNRSENHPSWKHMYLMVMLAQFGLAAAYLIR
jgi:4-hydroxybenzoate polyprenyltransferase